MSVSIGKTDRRVILTTGLRGAAALIRWNVGACIEVSAPRRDRVTWRALPPPRCEHIRASRRFFRRRRRAEPRCLSARYRQACRRAWLTRTGEEKPAKPPLLRVRSSSSSSFSSSSGILSNGIRNFFLSFFPSCVRQQAEEGDIWRGIRENSRDLDIWILNRSE